MQEKLQQLKQWTITNSRIASIGALALVLILGGVMMFVSNHNNSAAFSEKSLSSDALSGVEIAMAGATSSSELTGTENSWPGELISLGNIPVQPSRAGTLSTWNVHIGETVYKGQVLGTLSAPPAMPDTVGMLADETKMLSMAKTSADAKRIYTMGRVTQLEELRANTEKSYQSSRLILGGAGSGTSSTLSMVDAKKAILRAMLRGALVKTYPIFSGSNTLPTRWTGFTLKDAIGSQNIKLRDTFPSVFFAALADIDTPDKLPIASGIAYFDLATRLADASIPDGAMLSDVELSDLKTMLHADQEAFIMATDALREKELMAIDKQKEVFEQLRMIDNEIAMLKQDLAMADGDVVAKDASYRTVEGATLGGSAIVAPQSGVVSSVLKKPGEFVEPGMPVAVVTGSGAKGLLVRIRIPSNVRKPEVGEPLTVLRTGFGEDKRSATLLGIGNALDDTGSVMADAILSESTDWPIGASVRVIAPTNGGVIIKLSSVWWNANGKPNIWAISDAGRAYAKTLVLGRTIGADIEVYDGLKKGEHYVAKIIPGITEDMLIGDTSPDAGVKGESSYEAAMRAMGM